MSIKHLLTFLMTLLLSQSVLSFNPQTYGNMNPKDNGKYKELWAKVDSLANEGLPESALKIVDQIYEMAEEENNSEQIIKAYIYRLKFKHNIEENAYEGLLYQLQEDVEKEKLASSKAIMHSMLAEMYWWYYQNNRWKFSARTRTINFDLKDIQTWTLDDLVAQTIFHYMASLEDTDSLQNRPVDIYKEIIQHGSTATHELRPTLYDFLAHRAIDFFMNTQVSITQPADKFELKEDVYLGDAESFANQIIKTSDTLSLHFHGIRILQKLLAFRMAEKNTDALIDADLKRLNFVRQHSINPQKDSLYLLQLQALEEEYQSIKKSAEISYHIASYYFNRSSKYKPLAKNTAIYKWDKKTALEICAHTISKFPKSRGAELCKQLKVSIFYHNISFQMENFVAPNQLIPLKLTYQNTSKVYVRILSIDRKKYERVTEGKYGKELFDALKRAGKTQWEKPFDLPDDKDYNSHITELLLPGQTAGLYIMMIANNPNFDYDEKMVAYNVFDITNISYIERENNDDLEFYALDRHTGQALKGISAQSYYDKYSYTKRRYITTKDKRYTTNNKGYFKVQATRGNDSKYIGIEFSNGDNYLDTRKNFYLYKGKQGDYSNSLNITLFTDRAIYRPGQTVYFKGIMLKSGNKKHEIVSDREVTVSFYDVNYQKIAEETLTTNEYGTLNGSFSIPLGLLNGQMHIQTPWGSKTIRVEEYKRPKFEVKVSDFEGNYRLEDTVSVKATAKAYAGPNITDAEVKYRVVRQPLWRGWWWYDFNSSQTEITNGVGKTNDKGEFELKFKAIPDRSMVANDKLVFRYTIYIDVTDLNGETQSAVRTMVVGQKALELGLNVPEMLAKQDKDEVTISTRNLNGEFVPAKGEIKISKLQSPAQCLRDRRWERPDKQIYSKEEWREQFPNNVYSTENDIRYLPVEKEILSAGFDTKESKNFALKGLKNWELGQYVAELTAKDAFGQPVSQKVFFTVYSEEGSALPYPVADWYVPVKSSGEPGETAQFLIGSGYDNLNVIYEVEHQGELVKTEHLTINNEQRLLEIPIEEKHRGNFSIHIAFTKDNRLYHHSSVIHVPYTNKELDIEFQTFRDKLQPGEKDEWRLIIKGHKGDKVAAEMLATLYDASLDQFVRNSWYFNIYQHYYSQLGWSGGHFSTANSNLVKLGLDQGYYVPGLSYSSFNWFGFSYYNYYRYRALEEVAYSTGAPSRIRGIAKPKAAERMEDSMDMDEVVVEREASTPAGEDKRKNGDGEENKPEEAPISSEEPQEEVQVRTNLNETAFFYPELKTNKKGEVIISFTVPEALTRWRMMGFAHTKDLRYGFVENELITQKELMVMPNPPRFFREGDKLAFPVKIANVADKDLSGTATLEILDAITLKPIEGVIKSKVKQEFSVKQDGNTSLSWDLKIPVGSGVFAYRVIARADKFSDGEQKALPVLTNRMLVTESMPLPVRGKGTSSFTFTKLKENKSKTLKHHKLTLEFTSNPAWYAVQALPYMMEYPYECTEQTFSRFYANSIATHVANSSPKIKRVFDAWAGDPDDQPLMSNLEKNQELKSVLLQETPWVLDAQDENKRKHRVALLFDLNRMSGELQRAMRKLQQAQSSNGGWPWFKGMPESRYITQHIVTGMGHLDRLGIKNVRKDGKTWQMIEKAVGYLDSRIQEDYNWLKRNYTEEELKENHLSYIAIHYLYGRSYFMDIAIPRANKEAFEYYKGQAESYWLQNNKYSQGMIALALHRFDSTAVVPQKIVKSLREHALVDEEMGMYWKDNVSGWYWYQAPIETQALMVEVFDEVGDDQQAVNDLKVWLLKQKQTQDWKTTKATSEAVYALLLRGGNWLENDELAEIRLGKKLVDPKTMDNVKIEAGTGYFKTSWGPGEIKSNMADVSVKQNHEGVAWGAVYWQYFEDLDKISPHETPLSMKKQLFVELDSDRGKIIEPISKRAKLEVGDKIIVRIELRVDRDMEFVHMKDMRASGLEPINVISRYKYQDGLGYYESTKDASTNFFFDYLRKGTYVFEYPLRVSHSGNFSNGITTIQCMYAPEFTSHSEGIRIKIEE